MLHYHLSQAQLGYLYCFLCPNLEKFLTEYIFSPNIDILLPCPFLKLQSQFWCLFRCTWASSPTSASGTSPGTAPGASWPTRPGTPSATTAPTGSRARRLRTTCSAGMPAGPDPARTTTPAWRALGRTRTTDTPILTPLAGPSSAHSGQHSSLFSYCKRRCLTCPT